MDFEFQNIGKFGRASVSLDGLTVLAGENSTGKSTVEKAVALYVSSLYNLSDFIQSERKSTALASLRKYGMELDTILKNLSQSKRRHHVSDTERLQKEYAAKIAEEAPEEWEALIREYVRGHAEYYPVAIDVLWDDRQYQNWEKELLQQLHDDADMDDDAIGTANVSMFVRQFFSGQIIRIGSEEDVSEIRCRVQEHENVMQFQRIAKSARDICQTLNIEIPVSAPCVYIDSPCCFDAIHGATSREDLPKILRFLLSPGTMGGFSRKDMWNAFHTEADKTVIQQENEDQLVQKFYQMLQDVVGGHLELTSANRIQFIENGSSRAIEMDNVSTGIKSLSVMEYALENGCITENSIVILDEPEINLHPDWQLKYAEILIRMQKEMNLKLLITTHSPYFLDALEVYSAKYKIADKCRYYLTRNEDSISSIQEITDNIEAAYQYLAEPFQQLENTKYDISRS